MGRQTVPKQHFDINTNKAMGILNETLYDLWKMTISIKNEYSLKYFTNQGKIIS